MDIRQFRTELARAFEAAGFEQRRAKPPMKTTVWVFPGREVDREFWEHAIRRRSGFLLSGVVSIDVPAFRAWLNNTFPKDQHGILWSGVLSRHIANERDMFFAVEEGQPPYHDWVMQIRRRLAVLPDTVEGLLRAKEEHAEGLQLDAAPAAWRYFASWATGQPPANRPPHSLPDGRIVEAAANDPA